MEDMEKNTRKKEIEGTEELEISQRMSERADDIDNTTYRYLAELLELNESDSEEKFPWNIEILRKVFDSAVSVLQEYGYAVCNPYVAMSESGRQYRCTLSECGCGNCNCQEDFMEKQRILSGIEEAIARSGMKVLDGDDDCILVRNSRMDMDFQISVKSLEE